MLPKTGPRLQNSTFMRWSHWHAFALLALATATLYGHTLNVPWYFDDHSVILENPFVQDFGWAISGLLRPRGVSLFTFAVNYHFAGEQVFSYHLTNIAIHLLCSCLVYLLLTRLCSGKTAWALPGALLFLAHPLQTQAVTYVVQRMTSLAALFFLLALYLFLRFRDERRRAAPGGPGRARRYYAAALLAGALAVFSKENAAVLPLALILFVRCFEPDDREWRPLLRSVAPFILAPLALTVVMFVPLLTGQIELPEFTGLTGSEANPWRYLVTQFSVLWLYLRLLILPYGQTLDYGYPLATGLWNAQSLLALAALLTLGASGWRLRHRLPAVAFGLGWFFLTLVVESSLIPLDPVFEHRLYLPMFGFVTALTVTARECPLPRLAASSLLVTLVVFAVLAWQRNQLWNAPLAFSMDNVAKRPHSDRAFYNLAVRTINGGDQRAGIDLLRQSLQRFPQSCRAYLTLADLAKGRGDLDEGILILQQAAANCTDKALAYNNLGFFHGLKQQPDLAWECLTKARAANPRYAESYFNTARFLAANHRYAEAEEFFRAGFERSRKNPEAYVDFGRFLERQGRRQDALEAFRAALKLAPGNAAAAAGLAANR